ncbi:MAG: class B sortase [Clostridiales bacterium]|nr:class B sortase [Clostridiales bacterium]
MTGARIAITAVLAAVIAVNSYRLFEMSQVYLSEEKSHDSVLAYKPPTRPTPSMPASVAIAYAPEASVINQSVVDLQGINSDIVGWIAIEGTNIDYPFAQSGDNAFYLGNDVYKTPAKAGSVFMDFRCAPDFTGSNSILYGHSMKNGKMFADILKFKDEDFFDQHLSGTVFLSNATYDLEIFAFLVTKPMDWPVFFESEGNYGFLSYVKSHAALWRDIEIGSEDRLVTLSTCSYDFKDARGAIVGRLVTPEERAS